MLKSHEYRRVVGLPCGFPRIVCLCGSTKFVDVFNKTNRELTLDGTVVLSVGCHVNSDSELKVTEDQKKALDELHKRKIDLADVVVVLNCHGYIGDSTASEVAYAEKTGKPVCWLESSGSVTVACGEEGCGWDRTPNLTSDSLAKLVLARKEGK